MVARNGVELQRAKLEYLHSLSVLGIGAMVNIL